MKKIVVLTGAGMSVESGLSTFRDADGLWENYPVSRVATHEAWEDDPEYVNNFYNMLRKKLVAAKPNDGHKLVAKLEEQYEVTVITQNVDNLHEMAGSTHVIHLHGELMKVCSSRDVDNPRYQKTLGGDNLRRESWRRLFAAPLHRVLRRRCAQHQHCRRGGFQGRHLHHHRYLVGGLSGSRTCTICLTRRACLSH